MKNLTYLLSMFVLLVGCTPANVPSTKTEYIVNDFYSPVTIVELDSCQYFLGQWGNATVLTHKGNCKFCAERNLKLISKPANQ